MSRRIRLAVVSTATFALLAAWTLVDVSQIPDIRAVGVLTSVVGFGAVLYALGIRFESAPPVRLGLVFVGGTYLVAHIASLGVDVAAAALFLTAGILVVELRTLGRRFDPLLASDLPEDTRRLVLVALVRSTWRLFITSLVAVFLPLLAADVALAGTLPVTTVPAALVLAGGLVAVVLLLARLPGARATPHHSRESGDAGAKTN